MKGDALASGARSATFTGPHIKIDEGVMRDDLKKLSADDFILKYMITQREYDLLVSTKDEEKISSFASEMKAKAEMFNRGIALDEQQAASLKRECFLEPFVPCDLFGRVLVDRDEPAIPRSEATRRLIIPRRLQTEKTLLPTTGHIIKAKVFDNQGFDHSPDFVGKRILFGQMSGTAICFKNYPTWQLLELTEIMCIVPLEDAEVEDTPLEPMV